MSYVEKVVAFLFRVPQVDPGGHAMKKKHGLTKGSSFFRVKTEDKKQNSSPPTLWRNGKSMENQ